MYAIKNKRTGKWVYGTDFRTKPYRQRTSHNEVKTYECLEIAKIDFLYRQCGKDYIVVKVDLVEKVSPIKPIVTFSDGIRSVDCSNCDEGYAHKIGAITPLNHNYCLDCGVEFDWRDN